MNKLSKKSDGWYEICAERIRKKESFRAMPYDDQKGIRTCFYGLNLKQYKFSQLEVRFILEKRTSPREIGGYFLYGVMYDCVNELVAYFADEYGRPLGSVQSFESLPDNVKIALVDMGYNMGMPSLFGFEKMFEAIDRRDWETASIECLDSIYGRDKDSKARAEENAELIRGCV